MFCFTIKGSFAVTFVTMYALSTVYDGKTSERVQKKQQSQTNREEHARI